MDLGPNRSAALRLSDFAAPDAPPRPSKDLTILECEEYNGQSPTARYVSGKRGCRGRREHSVNEALKSKTTNTVNLAKEIGSL